MNVAIPKIKISFDTSRDDSPKPCTPAISEYDTTPTDAQGQEKLARRNYSIGTLLKLREKNTQFPEETVLIATVFHPQEHQNDATKAALENMSQAYKVKQRRKQIEIGKQTLEYEQYARAVPRNTRGPADPHTPNAGSKLSKRRFNGLIRKWRRQLHEYEGLTRPHSKPNQGEPSFDQCKMQWIPVDNPHTPPKSRQRRPQSAPRSRSKHQRHVWRSPQLRRGHQQPQRKKAAVKSPLSSPKKDTRPCNDQGGCTREEAKHEEDDENNINLWNVQKDLFGECLMRPERPRRVGRRNGKARPIAFLSSKGEDLPSPGSESHFCCRPSTPACNLFADIQDDIEDNLATFVCDAMMEAKVKAKVDSMGPSEQEAVNFFISKLLDGVKVTPP